MKSTQIIRILAGLSFLIFLCPFFQMCSDESLMVKIPVHEVATSEGMTAKEISEMSAASAKEIELAKKEAKEEAKKEYTVNAYELAVFPFLKSDEFLLRDLFDIQLYAFLCYILIIVMSIILLINIIRKKHKRVLQHAVTILILMTVPLIIFYKEDILEDINQIKWGYYLFFINIFAIIYFARKANIKMASHAV